MRRKTGQLSRKVPRYKDYKKVENLWVQCRYVPTVRVKVKVEVVVQKKMTLQRGKGTRVGQMKMRMRVRME